MIPKSSRNKTVLYVACILHVFLINKAHTFCRLFPDGWYNHWMFCIILGLVHKNGSTISSALDNVPAVFAERAFSSFQLWGLLKQPGASTWQQ